MIGIGFANGTSGTIFGAVSERGLLTAALNTFDTSMFVWLALGAALLLVGRSPPVEADRGDWAAAAVAGVAMLPPVPELSWLALTGLAFCALVRSKAGSALHRGAAILLALTFPTFWARIIMSLFSGTILDADATLVSWTVGTERDGNLVPFADGSGAVWISPACSAFANLSLAILTFVSLVNVTSGKWSLTKLGLGMLACALVVTINTTRIGLIGHYPDHFDLIHGAVGASIAGWLTTLVIMALGWLAVRRDAISLG